jgi:hypothetical protein
MLGAFAHQLAALAILSRACKHAPVSEATRSRAQRRADTLEMLRALHHLWIATTSTESLAPYLVPVSYAWTGETLIVATASRSPTAMNLFASKLARVAVGATDDVVLIDVVVESAVAVSSASNEIADAYAAQSDWDPRTGTDLPSHYFVLTPVRIQAWRLASELPGRTIMKNGEWLTDE